MNCKNNGFTLIEMIVGIFVMMLLLSSLTGIIVTTLRFNERIVKRALCVQNALSSLNTITSEIRASKGIVASSTKDKLILDFNTYFVSYDYNLGKIRRIKNLSSQYLTDNNLIKSLSFSYKSLNSANVSILPFSHLFCFTAETMCRNK